MIKDIVENLKIDTYWIIGGNSTKSLYSEIFKWETHNPIDIVYGDGKLIIKDIINSTIEETPCETFKNCRYFIVHKNSNYYVSNMSNELLNRSLFT